MPQPTLVRRIADSGFFRSKADAVECQPFDKANLLVNKGATQREKSVGKPYRQGS
jgi:hypothetical protein